MNERQRTASRQLQNDFIGPVEQDPAVNLELGISLPCKVHNFSVIEMQNDFPSMDGYIAPEVRQTSYENRHLLTVTPSAIAMQRRMLSDCVSSEEAIEARTGVINQLIAKQDLSVKFEIDFQNSCVFDSTQIEGKGLDSYPS